MAMDCSFPKILPFVSGQSTWAVAFVLLSQPLSSVVVAAVCLARIPIMAPIRVLVHRVYVLQIDWQCK